MKYSFFIKKRRLIGSFGGGLFMSQVLVLQPGNMVNVGKLKFIVAKTHKIPLKLFAIIVVIFFIFLKHILDEVYPIFSLRQNCGLNS